VPKLKVQGLRIRGITQSKTILVVKIYPPSYLKNSIKMDAMTGMGGIAVMNAMETMTGIEETDREMKYQTILCVRSRYTTKYLHLYPENFQYPFKEEAGGVQHQNEKQKQNQNKKLISAPTPKILGQRMSYTIEKLPMKIDSEEESFSDTSSSSSSSSSSSYIKYSKKTYSYSVYPRRHQEMYLDIVPEKMVCLGSGSESSRYLKANVHLSKDTPSTTIEFIQEFFENIRKKINAEPEFKDKRIEMSGPFYYHSQNVMRVKFQPNLMKIYNPYGDKDFSVEERPFGKEDIPHIERIQIRIGYIHMLNVNTNSPKLVIVPCVRKVFLKDEYL
jgi:hypothetical protein